jgi:hypothetical protein
MDKHRIPCEEVRAASHGFVEGEIEDDRGRAIRRHLEECGACAARIEEIRAVRALYPAWRAPAPREGFVARVLEAAGSARDEGDGRSSGAPRRIVPIPIPVAVAATVLLAVSLGFNALWVLYRNRLVGESVPPVPVAAPYAFGPSPFESAPGGAVRPAFYFYLDPTEETTPPDEAARPGGP